MRTLSVEAAKSVLAETTSVVWLVCLIIDHPSMSTPIRVVNNTQDVVMGAFTFQAFPFEIVLPAERDDKLPEVTLSISNVDQSIIQALRGLLTPPTIQVLVTTDADTNICEIGPLNFELKEITYDALVITGVLSYEDILNEPYPHQHFTPTKFPGLF